MELPLETGTQTTRDGPERQVFRNIQHEDYESPRDVPYRHIDVLGNGHYGFVDEVEAKSQQADGSTAVTYARKTILVQKARSAETTRRIRNEIDIMKRLDHEHVIRIAATYTVGNRFAILMQPVATMNLAEYMDRHPKPASDSPMRCWFGCLASSLAYLHSERIKHRDIKPANILIKGATIILTDFGIAHDVQDDLTSSTVGTVDSKTPMYCAPEVADEKRRGRAADIFSLGCVFLEMAT
ncbi:kinase-like protein, partial [Mytilinidion resinicola]